MTNFTGIIFSTLHALGVLGWGGLSDIHGGHLRATNDVFILWKVVADEKSTPIIVNARPYALSF